MNRFVSNFRLGKFGLGEGADGGLNGGEAVTAGG
jgi:hypothetical protein